MTLKQFHARLTVAFWCGFLLHSFMTCAIQDWHGLEKYIAVVRAGWWNIPWWMWLPLIMLTLLVDHENKKLKPVYLSKQAEQARQFEHGGTIYEGHSRDKS